MRTFTELQTMVTSYLGGTPTFITAAQIVNDSYQKLVNSYAWSFRRRPPYQIGFTQDQNYITLPTDFGEIQTIQPYTGIFRNWIPASLDKIANFRSGLVTFNNTDIYYAESAPGQTSATVAQGAPQLEIYPTPAATQSPVAVLLYLSKVSDLSSGTDKPNIRPEYEHLLVDLCLAYTDKYYNKDTNAVSNVLEGKDFNDMKRADARVVANLGQPTGGQVFTGSNRGWLTPIKSP